VLFYIGVRPDCTIQEISDGLSLTDRTVYGVVGELRSERMVNVRKDGRRHHYSVNYDTIVGHSVVQGGAELRHALRFLISRTLVLLDEGESQQHQPSGHGLPTRKGAEAAGCDAASAQDEPSREGVGSPGA
jgi:DNA-binding transcriptional ArsR family regulator